MIFPHQNKKRGTFLTHMKGTNRADIQRGLFVAIVEKQNQRSGKLTEGHVQDILTNSSVHPHGIKVRLSSGKIGRVAQILQQSPPQTEK